jgi:hypothetical protein
MQIGREVLDKQGIEGGIKCLSFLRSRVHPRHIIFAVSELDFIHRNDFVSRACQWP